jgi:hypothetical protein
MPLFIFLVLLHILGVSAKSNEDVLSAVHVEAVSPSAVPTTKMPSFSPTIIPSKKPSLMPSIEPTRVAAVASQSVLQTALGVQPLYDGETNSFVPTSISYASNVAGTGVLGSVGLQLAPDPWHSPTFVLLSPAYRSNIGIYSAIRMYARCSQAGTPLSMHSEDGQLMETDLQVQQ